MNPTHKIASKHLDTYAHTLTQNPNTESFPLSIKTQTATCFPSVKDQIELFLTRCAGMHCACTGSNLSLFLASVGSSYITPCCHSTFEYTFGPHIVRHSTNADQSSVCIMSLSFPELAVEASSCVRESTLCYSIYLLSSRQDTKLSVGVAFCMQSSQGWLASHTCWRVQSCNK